MRLGYSGSQIPHATGTSAAGIARAQQFSRPSTATALGAHGATRFGGAGFGSAATSRYGAGLPAGVHPQQPQGGKKKPPPGYVPPGRAGGFRGGYHPSFGGSAPAPAVPHGGAGGSFHGGGGGGHGGGHR
jgi:hypothetical protein